MKSGEIGRGRKRGDNCKGVKKLEKISAQNSVNSLYTCRRGWRVSLKLSGCNSLLII